MPESGNETVETVALTTADIFTEAGTVMGKIVGMAGDFFTSLWENPMGKIICVLGVVSAGIGLAYRLFLRRKHV